MSPDGIGAQGYGTGIDLGGDSVAFRIACYKVQAFSTNVNDIAVSFHPFRIQRVESRNSAKR